MRWDLVNNVVTIISRVPIEKVFVQRPYQAESPISSANKTQVLYPVPAVTEEDPEWMEQKKEQADARDKELDSQAEAKQVEAAEPASEYAGFSQISAAGKACIPCSGDHMSTVAGELAEAIRFAREGGVTHPEVMFRITDAEDQLNALERIDGAPIKVQKLPADEKALMNEMIASSREMRHMLKDIANVEDLEALAAHAQEQRRKYRMKMFELQMAKLSPEQKRKIEEKAAEARA